MIGTAEQAGPTAFGRWSQSCAEYMSRRSNFVVGGLDTARQHMLDITGGRCEFSANRPGRFLDFGGTNIRLGRTSIHYLKWNSETEYQTSTVFPHNFHIVLHVPLRGDFEAIEGARRASANVGEMLVVSSPGVTVKRWHGSAELLNIIVPRDALARLLALDFGITLEGPLDIEPLASLRLDDVGTLTSYIETVISDLSGGVPFFSDPLVAAQAERTFLLLLLKAIPHAYLDALNAPRSQIAPFYVRRAETFMREHIRDCVGIEQLAAVAGVSARTLYYGFKQHRNVTPMKYLKQLRLTIAREELLAARAWGGKVGDVAASCGYANLSQFSRDYRDVYGESPAQTLRGHVAAN